MHEQLSRHAKAMASKLESHALSLAARMRGIQESDLTNVPSSHIKSILLKESGFTLREVHSIMEDMFPRYEELEKGEGK